VASEKISDMVAATQVNNADLIPIVQGGSNLSSTRQLLLTSNGTEDLTIASDNAEVVIGHLGNVEITANNAREIHFNVDGVLQAFMTEVGSSEFNSPLHHAVFFGGSANSSLIIYGALSARPQDIDLTCLGGKIDITSSAGLSCRFTAAGDIQVTPAAGQTFTVTTTAGGIISLSGTTATLTADLTVSGKTQSRSYAGSGTAPTVAVGTAAGTGGTASVTGNDVAGQITVNVGTAPAGSAIVATITFHVAKGAAPIVTLTPANTNAASTGNRTVYVTSTTTTFVLNVTVTTLTASTTYIFNYHVFGN